MLLSLGALASAEPVRPPTEKHEWTRVVTVDKHHATGTVLQRAFHKIVATGIGGNAAAQVLKRVGDYMDSEVAARGQATLSIGMLVEAVTAAKAAKWSPEDTSRLAIALQHDFGHEQSPDVPRLQAVIAQVLQGSRSDEILGEGDTLKETKRAR